MGILSQPLPAILQNKFIELLNWSFSFLREKMSKFSTNLTHMAVSKNAHTKLALIYSKNLRVLAKMPSDYAYRKNTEQIIMARAGLVKSESNVAELEKKINCGQIEEVVIQAENELNLSRKILEWKAWEPLVEQPPKNQWKWPL